MRGVEPQHANSEEGMSVLLCLFSLPVSPVCQVVGGHWYPKEILLTILWLTHMYEHDLSRAGSGSLP